MSNDTFNCSSDINLNVSFSCYISKILINHLLHMPLLTVASHDLTDILQKSSSDNPDIPEIRNNYLEDYSPKEPIQCIRQHPRISTILSQAFSKTDAALLLQCNFLLQDLSKQFKRHACDTPMGLYRSEHIATADLNKLRKRWNQYVLCPSLLSTTTDSTVLLPVPGRKRVVYHIRADPTLAPDQPSALAHSL